MWQRFTEKARKTVFYAQEEAQRLGEGYISTEHLLLGLLREECTATSILATLGCEREVVREAVKKHLPENAAKLSTDMTLTPRAKRVIDLAYDEAKFAGHNYIGTEHLLGGLIREGDGMAGTVLSLLGVTIGGFRFAMANVPSRSATVRTPMETSAGDPTRWRILTNLFRLASQQQRFVMGEVLTILALFDESEEAGRLLAAIGLDAEHLRAKARIWLYEQYEEKAGEPEPSFAEFLVLADAERQALGHSRTEAGHLILAVLKREGPGKCFLESCGLSHRAVAGALRDFYG
jgi:ATP-dependent Clp protease ATP-binding subunit ClpA